MASECGVSANMVPFWFPKSSKIASWKPLGASWKRLGASWGVLGASWGVLGASWGVLEASWGVLRYLRVILEPS